MVIGVVVVTFNAAEVILDCLESMLASQGADLRIVVVDNASTDNTIETLQQWADGKLVWSPKPNQMFEPVKHGKITLSTSVPPSGTDMIALIASPNNTGFAGGVNTGLRLLKDDPDIDFFWVLNPDCVAENKTANTLLSCAANAGPFGVIGGRIFYKDPPLMIQSDGGRIKFLTGTCVPYNLGQTGRNIPAPTSESLDYISGSHMFVSRLFLETAGLMPEEYFLYYEEMDWCCRRGDLPLLFCPKAAVHHDGGHTLGSATLAQGPSAMSSYYMGRSRMRFVKRYRPAALPVAFLYSFAKALKFLMKGQHPAGIALLRGIFGLGPSRDISQALNPKLNSNR